MDGRAVNPGMVKAASHHMRGLIVSKQEALLPHEGLLFGNVVGIPLTVRCYIYADVEFAHDQCVCTLPHFL